MLQPANGVMPPVPGKHVTQKSWMDALQDILPSMPIDLNPQVNTRMSASLKRAGMDWNNVPYPQLLQSRRECKFLFIFQRLAIKHDFLLMLSER
jgi:hypothetical protein